jgi:hypothetical protein
MLNPSPGKLFQWKRIVLYFVCIVFHALTAMQFLVTIQGGYNYKENKPDGFPYSFNEIDGFPFPGLSLFSEAVGLSLNYITI